MHALSAEMKISQQGKAEELGVTTGWKRALRALQYRNYRLYFGGQGISLIGTWMQRIAMSWLVYRLTNSAFMLGLIGFAGSIPSFIFGPIAGVLADRYNRRRMLIITQSLALLQAFILALLVLGGKITIWQILLLGIFLGFVEALDMPMRQSFMVEIVQKKDLGNAIALNSSMVNSSRLLGPSIAGVLIASMGEGMCFLLNSVSYLAVIISLLAMRVPPGELSARRSHILEELREGLLYAYSFRPIRSILMLLALVSLVGMPYSVLMPVFARDVLHGGPHTLGFLLGGAGVGALTGAIYLASRKSVLGLGRWIAMAAGIFGTGLIIFSLSRVFWFSLVLMLVTGFGMIVQMASSNTVLQTIVEENKRGRVMSLYAMAFRGMVPFGSLLAGIMASRLGAPLTLVIGGGCCIAGSLFFARNLPRMREMVRPIYQRMGVFPDIDM
jgi:MFS family permease